MVCFPPFKSYIIDPLPIRPGRQGMAKGASVQGGTRIMGHYSNLKLMSAIVRGLTELLGTYMIPATAARD
jgi:hypothetical protein